MDHPDDFWRGGSDSYPFRSSLHQGAGVLGGGPNYMRLILSFLEAAQLRFFVVRALLKQHHLLCGDYAARHSQLL